MTRSNFIESMAKQAVVAMDMRQGQTGVPYATINLSANTTDVDIDAFFKENDLVLIKGAGKFFKEGETKTVNVLMVLPARRWVEVCIDFTEFYRLNNGEDVLIVGEGYNVQADYQEKALEQKCEPKVTEPVAKVSNEEASVVSEHDTVTAEPVIPAQSATDGDGVEVVDEDDEEMIKRIQKARAAEPVRKANEAKAREAEKATTVSNRDTAMCPPGETTFDRLFKSLSSAFWGHSHWRNLDSLMDMWTPFKMPTVNEMTDHLFVNPGQKESYGLFFQADDKGYLVSKTVNGKTVTQRYDHNGNKIEQV